VAIIDDREDVWGRSPNLIHVKPYLFFSGTSDINAPPTSNHGKRHVGRLHHRHAPYQQQHRRRLPPGKAYSLSNPQPFKTRLLVRQPSAPAAECAIREKEKEHPTVLPVKSHDQRELEVRNSAAKDVQPTHTQMPDSSEEIQDSKDNASCISGTAEHNLQSTGMGSMEDVSSSTPGETLEEMSDVRADMRGSRVELPSNSSAESSITPVLTEEHEDMAIKNSDLQTPADMSVEEEGSNEVSEGLASESARPPLEVLVSSSDLFSENSNNNNNNKDGDGVVKKGDGSDSDSSSDSSSSISSSSGIDDSLFDDMAAHDAGDEGEGEVSVSSTGQNGEAAENTGPDVPSDSDKVPGLSANMSERDHTKTAPLSVEIKDPDTFLLQLADILERVHAIFYEQYDGMTSSNTRDCAIPDLKKIIPNLRHSILKGCRILFTGIIPTNMPPRKNAEWRTARAFGATIHTELIHGLDSTNEEEASRATSHVIAGKPGTSKLHEASRLPGVKIVSPKWLWACAEHWKRVDEGEFLLKHPMGKKHKEDGGSNPPSSKRRSLSVESTQDNDGKTAEEVATSIVNLRQSFDKSTAPDESVAAVAEVDDSDSDSCSSDDNIFKNSVALSGLAKMDTTQMKRHLSLESRLSVSDKELVRMDAEVEAEISESSSSSSSRGGDEEELGTHLEVLDHNDNPSYENFAGTDSSDDLDSVMLERRKRKFDEMRSSSSSESDVPAVESFLNESVISDEDQVKSGEDEEEDELSKLLGF